MLTGSFPLNRDRLATLSSPEARSPYAVVQGFLQLLELFQERSWFIAITMVIPQAICPLYPATMPGTTAILDPCSIDPSQRTCNDVPQRGYWSAAGACRWRRYWPGPGSSEGREPVVGIAATGSVPHDGGARSDCVEPCKGGKRSGKIDSRELGRLFRGMVHPGKRGGATPSSPDPTSRPLPGRRPLHDIEGRAKFTRAKTLMNRAAPTVRGHSPPWRAPGGDCRRRTRYRHSRPLHKRREGTFCPKASPRRAVARPWRG